MFARTKRLTLRPGWPEDAPALTRAIAHEDVARMLIRVPWPYLQSDAERFLEQQAARQDPRFLILCHADAVPRIVGGIGIQAHDGGHDLGYWLTPEAWGRGYATEAGEAVIAMARHALGIRRLEAGHFVDNPASGRVLTKLGFRATGRIELRRSCGRKGTSPFALFERDLADDRCVPMPIAA